MKKKALLASVITIALCFSAIAGSTYALFTDSKQINIAVTSGDVEVLASFGEFNLYSAEGPVAEHNDRYLKDEYGSYYKHIPVSNNFSNGGTVVNDGALLSIQKITPGDKVEFALNVSNDGDVAMKYRYIVKVDTTKNDLLASGMMFTAHDGTEMEGVYSYTSEWFDDLAAVNTHKLSLELPVYARNVYQSEDNDEKGVSYIVYVEGIQANAVTLENTSFVEFYATSIQNEINAGRKVNLAGGYVDAGEGFFVMSQPTGFVNGELYSSYAGGSYALLCNDFYNATPYGVDFSLVDATLATRYPGQITVVLHEGSGHKINVDADSKIEATGTGSACIQIGNTDCELVLKSADSLVAENGAKVFIVNQGVGTLNIVVPDSEVEAITSIVLNPEYTYKADFTHISVNGVEIAAGVAIQ